MISAMFPLESALLPGEELPLRIFEPRYATMVQDCLAGAEQTFGVVMIAGGREVGGGDVRCDVGALVRIAEAQDFGSGIYSLRCPVQARIRVLEWLPDDPYPRASIELWPDEPGDGVTGAQITEVEDRVMAVFERIAAVRSAQLPPRHQLLGEPEPGESAGERLYALASRIPMGQADRYSVLSAPSAAQRLIAVSDAVETVTAMVEFQLLSEPGDDSA